MTSPGVVQCAVLAATSDQREHRRQDAARRRLAGARPGEIVALVGPNGAGKSTLLRVLSRRARAARRGTMRLKGRDARVLSPRELPLHRAVLSQKSSVAFPFTVAEIVRMGAGDRRGRRDRRPGRGRARRGRSGRFPRPHHHHAVRRRAAARAFRARAGAARLRRSGARPGRAAARRADREPRPAPSARHAVPRRGAAPIAASPWSRSCTISISRRCSPSASSCSTAAASPATARRRAITDDMLARVFGVAGAVGRAPAAGTPFVLPHGARKLLPGKS